VTPTTLAQVDAHEGPVYVADEDALYFTSVPRPGVAIKRLSLRTGEVSVLRGDANKANGMALALDGRLVVCEQGTRSKLARVSLVDRETGVAETLVDGWRGLPLNSPNDVGRQVRRHGLVHGPLVWLPAGLQTQADARGRRLSPRPPHRAHDHRRERVRQAQRLGVLA
jgi:hypothetical protein